MRTLLKTVKLDLLRLFFSGSFPLTVLLLFLIQFVPFLPVLLSQATPVGEWQYVLAQSHWGDGIPQMILFIGAIAYAWSYRIDVDSDFFNQIAQRVGIHNYCVSRIFVTILSGFLAGVLADVLFTLLLLALGLSGELAPEYAGQAQYVTLAVNGQTGLYLTFRYIQTGMVCGAVSVVGLACSTFFKNAYLAVFCPMMIYAVTRQVSGALKLPGIGILTAIFGHRYRDDQVRSFWHMMAVMTFVMVLFGVIFYKRVRKDGKS